MVDINFKKLYDYLNRHIYPLATNKFHETYRT